MDSRKVPTVETYHMISPQSEIHDAEPSGFGDERLQEQWRVQDEVWRFLIHSTAVYILGHDIATSHFTTASSEALTQNATAGCPPPPIPLFSHQPIHHSSSNPTTSPLFPPTPAKIAPKNHKRTIRFFCLTSRFFSLLMSASTLGIMAFSLHSYYTTHLRTINGTHAWPQPAPVLWPTYLLFAISFVTFGGEYGIEVGLLDHRGCCVEAGPGDHILHIYLSYKEPLEVDIIYTYVWLLTTTTRATR